MKVQYSKIYYLDIKPSNICLYNTVPNSIITMIEITTIPYKTKL